MSTLDRNKPTRKDRLRLIISGVQKHYPNGTLVLAGQTFNVPTQLVQFIQQDIDATDVADKARAAWLERVQVQEDSHQKVAPVLRALKSAVLSLYGDTQNASSTLADFGYSPRKLTAKTSAKKAQAADKGLATRAARHTLGKKQKKDIKGTVPAPTKAPEPVPAPATPPAPVKTP